MSASALPINLLVFGFIAFYVSLEIVAPEFYREKYNYYTARPTNLIPPVDYLSIGSCFLDGEIGHQAAITPVPMST